MWPKIAKEIVATNPNENSPIKKILQPILINYYVRLQQQQQQKRKIFNYQEFVIFIPKT